MDVRGPLTPLQELPIEYRARGGRRNRKKQKTALMLLGLVEIGGWKCVLVFLNSYYILILALVKFHWVEVCFSIFNSSYVLMLALVKFH